MENKDIQLRPASIFAFIKILHILLLSIIFLYLSLALSPYLIWFSFFGTMAALYRYLFIRKLSYQISGEYIRITKGIFFKRVDQTELYRVKGYVILQPPVLQLFRLMHVTLQSTDIENPVIQMIGIPRSDLIDEIRDRVQQARKYNQIYEIN